jgi:Holliday junction resolvasome RuvABC endonuclease subunit
MKLEVRNWCIAAIDPGMRPTVCIFWDRGAQVRFFEGLDTSESIAQGGKDGRVSAAPNKLMDILQHHKPHMVAVERVWVRPNQGAVSQAKLIYSAGICVAVARTCGAPSMIETYPQNWQRYHGIYATADKKFHIRRATQVEPTVALHLGRVKDHDRADAFLIGKYAEAILDRTYEHGVRNNGRPIDWVPTFRAVR